MTAPAARLGPPPPAATLEVNGGASRRASREIGRPGWRQRQAAWFPIGAALLVVAAVVTRLPFMTQTLYAFDSANYALGVRDAYNVAFHQPHPPGYPLYVFFGRAINTLVDDANRALVLEGIAWSALAVAATIALARAMFGRALALVAGLLLVCTVGFWGYAEVAYPYVALAGESATIALLAHAVVGGRHKLAIALGLAWALSLGVRWDGAIFCTPLAIWALWTVPWRLRLASGACAALVVAGWATPMIALTGGWDTYRQVLTSYLQVWSPQSAYTLGDFASGGDTQATYNLNFLVNYLRQMLGVGLLLVVYLVGRRFGPARLATDYRSRWLALWVVPPLVVYVFAHLGEPGYVLSLAPPAATLIALAIFDLRDEVALGVDGLRARGWRWLPNARVVSSTVAAMLAVGVATWNVQAFARGVGPGRLPDLRAHDATTSAQIQFLRQQSPSTTLVLAHDNYRQLHFYAPEYPAALLFSEYVPSFETVRTRTDLPPGTERVVVLDSPLQVAPADAGRVQEVVLREQPRVAVWVVNVEGVSAIEHGFRMLRLLGT